MRQVRLGILQGVVPALEQEHLFPLNCPYVSLQTNHRITIALRLCCASYMHVEAAVCAELGCMFILRDVVGPFYLYLLSN